MEPTDTGNHGAWFNTTSTESVPDPVYDRGSWVPRVLIGLLALVSFLGPGAAGVWLALHGYRKAAGIGLALAVALPFVWTYIAYWPSTIIAAPVLGHGRSTNPSLVMLLSLIAAGWQYCVIAAWTFGVCMYFARHTHPGVAIEMGALAYGVVLGPLSFMATRDAGTESAPLLALALALMSFATFVTCYLLQTPRATPIAIIVGLVGFTALMNASLSAWAAAKQRRAGLDTHAFEGGSVNRALHQVISRGS